MKLVVLDRDGVINHDSDAFIKSPAEWQAIDGSLAAIAALNRAGYTVVVASNQSGLGRGLFDPSALDAIHAKMQQQLQAVGGWLDGIFYCPHAPEDGCACRKPQTGLFMQIKQQFSVVKPVWAVGDSLRDLQAAQKAGAKPVLVRTGKGEKTWQALPTNPRLCHTPVYQNLAAFVAHLLSTEI